MPLSSPRPREHIHHRTVDCKAYLREDGLWDIEGQVVDTKTYSYPAYGDRSGKEEVQAGEHIHDMWIRVTVDESMEVKEVEAAMAARPYWTCPEILPNFKRLIGLKIGKGWNRSVKERLGGTAGCTHIVELLAPVATTAFQAIGSMQYRRRRLANEPQPESQPWNLNSCHSWDSGGDMIREKYPQYYTGPAPKRSASGK